MGYLIFAAVALRGGGVSVVQWSDLWRVRTLLATELVGSYRNLAVSAVRIRSRRIPVETPAARRPETADVASWAVVSWKRRNGNGTTHHEAGLRQRTATVAVAGRADGGPRYDSSVRTETQLRSRSRSRWGLVWEQIEAGISRGEQQPNNNNKKKEKKKKKKKKEKKNIA